MNGASGMKKRTILIVTITLFLMMLPMMAGAEIVDSGTFGANGDNLTWTFDHDGILTISGTGAMKDYNSSDPPWYSYHSSIRSVVINNGVTNIGACVFQKHDMLSSISLPASLNDIGRFAFTLSNNLVTINVDDNNDSFCVIDDILYSKDAKKLENHR